MKCDVVSTVIHELSRTALEWAISENIHTYTTDGFKDFRRGGGVHDHGILRAWVGIYDWKSEGMGGISQIDFLE